MEVLLVFETMSIMSASGLYDVDFDKTNFKRIDAFIEPGTHFIVDSNLVELYPDVLKKIIESENTVIIDASEHTKEVNNVLKIVESLLQKGIKRNNTIVAVGGGVVQDITCFISSVLFRGIKWRFIPTTLLSQADSCIGSKSSINLGEYKNIIGTFKPPEKILICTTFLQTLDQQEIFSGIGEIIKVHAIDGEDSFDEMASSYDLMPIDPLILLKFIENALKIKKKYIELDEFDKGIRNIFNYGHSFGHAIESATNFVIPHGIAVTIGMDMANRIASQMKLTTKDHYRRMHKVLKKNYSTHKSTPIPLDKLVSALKKDKKNTASKLVLIMPVGDKADIQKVEVNANDEFLGYCEDFLDNLSV